MGRRRGGVRGRRRGARGLQPQVRAAGCAWSRAPRSFRPPSSGSTAPPPARTSSSTTMTPGSRLEWEPEARAMLGRFRLAAASTPRSLSSSSCRAVARRERTRAHVVAPPRRIRAPQSFHVGAVEPCGADASLSQWRRSRSFTAAAAVRGTGTWSRRPLASAGTIRSPSISQTTTSRRAGRTTPRPSSRRSATAATSSSSHIPSAASRRHSCVRIPGRLARSRRGDDPVAR